MTCKSEKDTYGTTFIVPAAEPVRTPTKVMLVGLPAVEVWWSRKKPKSQQETVIIRQEYEDRATADVIELTLGQTYDLIDALNKAVESI